MKRLWGMAVLLAAGMIAAMPAQAQWTGCHVGAHVGYGATHHDTSLDVVTPGLAGSALNVPLSSQGGAVGLGAGCDLQLQKLVIGAFGDYSWLSQTMEVTSPLLAGLGGGALNPIARLELDTSWTIGARAGLLLGQANSTLVYGLIGYTRMDTANGLTLLGTAGGTFGVPTFEGWTYGGGVSTELAKNIRLTAEYRYTKLDSVDVPVLAGPGGSLSVGIQPDMHTARLGISYAFTPDIGGTK